MFTALVSNIYYGVLRTQRRLNCRSPSTSANGLRRGQGNTHSNTITKKESDRMKREEDMTKGQEKDGFTKWYFNPEAELPASGARRARGEEDSTK